VTGWLGESHFASTPTAIYGVVMLMAAIAYYILQLVIIASQGPTSLLKKAVGNDWKGKASPVICVAAIGVALLRAPWISMALYVALTLMWLVPDTRIERALAAKES